ncbi:unnamed protein product [Penicillium egyptiacum]|uniref:Uncharacterized protein n=1 Tax=Penicillium egyptiacum TaxID=1303716 RepID=A0A9W4K2X7_9EURO|nr:unnamed protein product [Penicillium egyptiacum]
MERLYPLPETIRHALVDIFCSPDLAKPIKTSRPNKDCLIHLHLGRKRHGSFQRASTRFFSLRNYKMHVDQVQSLELEAESYASTMASALAVLRWNTKIDAMDIEFVLSSTPLNRNSIRCSLPLHDIKQLEAGPSTFEHTTNIFPNFRKRAVCL